MNEQKNRLFVPLGIAAAASVVAFSGIGIAAITGHLSITHSGMNPFSSFSGTSAGPVVKAAAVPANSHQGLTRNRGETPVEGKPVDFKIGARVAARKHVCADCGVVDSIIPGRTRTPAAGVVHSLAIGSETATFLRTARKASDQQDATRTMGFVVTVHMENGTVRTIYESERPPFDIGERIKLVNGSVIRLG
jgi:outer membrane lipoprotein SlyB